MLISVFSLHSYFLIILTKHYIFSYCYVCFEKSLLHGLVQCLDSFFAAQTAGEALAATMADRKAVIKNADMVPFMPPPARLFWPGYQPGS